MSFEWPPLHRPVPPGPPETMEEWLSRPEDQGGELVDGVVVEDEMPDAIHELTVSWLIALLSAWLGPRGFVLGSEAKLQVSKTRGRKADVTAYLPDQSPPRARGALHTPPGIVVEVISPTPRDQRRDRVEKMSDYATFGVRWYWLVDPALGTLEIFELGADGRWSKALGATAGAVTDVPGCPGLTVDLDALWARLARLPDDPEP